MSTPGIWFEARWGRRSRTALQEGSDTPAPQSWEQPAQQDQAGKWWVQSKDPAAPRCPEGHLNSKGAACPGRGHMSLEISWRNKSLAELRAHHTTSPPTPFRPSSLRASLAFIQPPLPQPFPRKSMAFPGFYPSQRFGLQLAAGLPGARVAFENFD